MAFLAKLKQEISVSKFGLTPKTPNDFVISQIGCLNKKSLWLIRVLLALYFIISFIIALTYYDNIALWAVYMTSINHIFVMMYFCSCAFISSHFIWRSRGKRNQPITEQQTLADTPRQVKLPGRFMQCYLKFHWLLFNLTINVCTFVFLAYWLLIFPHDEDIHKNAKLTYMTIDRHGLNFIILLFEFIFSNTPVHLLHFIYPSCFIGLYFISNIIYWACTEKLIYGKMLDYGSSTGGAVGMVIAAVVAAIPVIHFGWFLISMLKEKLCWHKEERDYELTNEKEAKDYERTNEADFSSNL